MLLLSHIKCKVFFTVECVAEFKCVCQRHISICMHPINRTARCQICFEYMGKNGVRHIKTNSSLSVCVCYLYSQIDSEILPTLYFVPYRFCMASWVFWPILYWFFFGCNSFNVQIKVDQKSQLRVQKISLTKFSWWLVWFLEYP